MAAEEHAVELLHDVTFRSALEGECEVLAGSPGWPYPEVRQPFTDRDAAGAHAESVQDTGDRGGDLDREPAKHFICGPEEREELIAMRQESLRRIAEKTADVTGLPAG